MGGLLAELGKQLAARWLSLLVLPGLLYLGTLAVADTLGHRHPFAVDRITRRLDVWTGSPEAAGTAGLVLVLAAIVLASAAAGVAAQALGSVTERIWLAEYWRSWPRPVRRLAQTLTQRRRRRWDNHQKEYRKQLDKAREDRAKGTPAGPNGSRQDLAQAHHQATHVAREEPARPTWIGDRVHAPVARLRDRYGLDLPTVWPHLWLAMPDSTRSEITTARGSFTRAATLAGWGLLYLAPGALWWPGLLIAVGTVGTAWRRARLAAEAYALLIEAATRLHTPDLAQSLGIDHTGPLNRQTGQTLTFTLQDKTDQIPLSPAAQ